MEYTELSAYDLPAGRATVWTPDAPSGAWRSDPRELSYDHEAHLAEDSSGAWIGSALRVPLRHDAGALRRALRAWTGRHEVLRTTVERGDAGWGRVTCAADAVDVQPGIPVSGDADAVRAHVLDAFAGVSPTAWPHVVFAAVEPEADEGGFVLLFGADHSVMDAYSQLLWFGEVVALYERALAGDTDRALAALDVGSHVDFAAFDRRLGMLVSPHDEAVATWRRFLTPADGEPGGELEFPAYPDPVVRGAELTTGTQHTTSTWVLDATAADDLNALCRDLGTGFQSAALGLLAEAVRRETGSARSAFVLPVHTRHEPRYAGSVGWYVGLCPVTVDVGAGATTADLVTSAHAAVRSTKHLASRPFARVAQLLGVRSAPRFVVSFVDVRHVPDAHHWAAWDARALRSATPDAHELYVWVIRSAHGVSVSARCTAGASERLASLVGTYGRLLGDAARDAGGARLPDVREPAPVAALA